jgi:hypothetical protein
VVSTLTPRAVWARVVIRRLGRMMPFSLAVNASVSESMPFSNSQYREVGLMMAWSISVGNSE